MSYTEFHTGKLKKVDYSGITLEQFCKNYCTANQVFELASYNKTWQQQLTGDFSDKYFIHDEDVYEYIDHEKSMDEESFMKLYKEDNGTISFIGSFYNGGTYFEEMLTDAFKQFSNK